MADLNKRIKELELKEKQQMAEIKENFSLVSESLKPSSLVKQAFSEFKNSKKLQQSVVDTTIGSTAGFLARKLVTLNSKNIVRKLTGYALQYVTTKLVTKKMPAIRHKMAEHKASS